MVKAVKSAKTKKAVKKTAAPKVSAHSASVLACIKVLAEFGAVSESTSVARKVIWSELLDRIGSHAVVATARKAGLVERCDYDKSSIADDVNDELFRDAKYLYLTSQGNAVAKEHGFKPIAKIRDTYRKRAKANGAL